MKHSPKSQARTLLSHAEKVLIVGSTEPAIDHVAGMLALQTLLKVQKKEVHSVLPASLPEGSDFLPEVKSIQKELVDSGNLIVSLSTKNAQVADVRQEHREGVMDLVISAKNGKFSLDCVDVRPHTGNFDAIVIIGADSLEDCGEIFSKNPELFSDVPVINISVSAGNEFFGKVNLVDAAASSVCEVLADLALADETWAKTIDKNLATTLLTGILGETESFLSGSTSARSFELAAVLQELGGDQAKVIEHLFKEKTLKNLRVLSRLLNTLNVDETHRLGWTRVNQSDFELIDAKPGDIDGWIDQLLRHVNGTDFVAMFVEEEDKTTVLIRSNADAFDLSELKTLEMGQWKRVRRGVNLEFPGQSIADIQSSLLRELANFQEARLSLERGQPIEKKKCIPTPPTPPTLPLKAEEKPGEPIAPKNVPFETQGSEKNSAGKEPGEKPETKKPVEKTSPGPSWLK
ncbi:MAG: hypothetical protein K9M51_03505 [Candidatus Gracilibacteria bacterium]|nr:hypothetical protein [Candidatus Gracilibacteria bacterium]